MPNWFSRQQERKKESRYSFSIYGDIFIPQQDNKENEKYNAQEILIGSLPTEDNIKINNYEIEPHRSVF